MSDERTEAERVDPNEHISSDDPRYDGFRIHEYWIATTVAGDNQEAPIGLDAVSAYKFHLMPGPAMAADERRLVHLREFAHWAAETYGIEVRIRHFVPEGEDEVFGA